MLVVEWDQSTGWGTPEIRPFGEISLAPAASALHYAVQCFEGLKAYKDKNGQEFDKSQLLECIKEYIRVDSDWVPSQPGYSMYIRPTMIGTQEWLGVGQSNKAMLFCIASPVGPYYKTGFNAVSLNAETELCRAWPGGTGAYKLGANYAGGILPQIKVAKEGYQQNLWLFGPEHELTEVGTMNCFVHWINEHGQKQLLTPSLDGTILPGVTRDSILQMTRRWNEFEVVEGRVTMAEVLRALSERRLLEMFGSGTASVVAPIQRIRYQGVDYQIPLDAHDDKAQAGPLATRLWNSLIRIQYGEELFDDCIGGPPHSSPFISPLEYSLYELFVERLLTWQVTLNASLEYFKELAEVERYREKGYRRAAAILAPKNITNLQQQSSSYTNLMNMLSRSNTPSPVKQGVSANVDSGNSPINSPVKPPDRGNIWLVPLQAAALKADSDASGLAAFIENETITRLREIKALFREHRNSLRGRLEQTYKELNLHHDRLIDAINVYQKTFTHGIEGQVDPWLSEMQLKGRIDGWLRMQRQHFSLLLAILQDIKSLDAQLTMRIGVVIQEYFVLGSKAAALQSEQLQDMAGLVQAVDIDNEWNAAMIKGRLDYDWKLIVPPTDAFAHTVHSQLQAKGTIKQHSIKKAGFLMKQSGGFSRSWSIYFCILTDSHYFHGYRTAGMDAEGKLEWMRIPTSSLQLHRKALAELNDVMLRGMFEERPELLAEPAISIALGGPGVAFKSDSSSSSSSSSSPSSSFSLISTSSGGFFGRSEKKNLFKSWQDEDLHEWTALIKEALQAAETEQEQARQVKMQPKTKVVQDEDDSSEIRGQYGLAQHNIPLPQPTSTPTPPPVYLDNPWNE